MGGIRLTEEQRTIIRTTVAETFCAGADVWLFGSRVDDKKRGGDIDLLIATDQVDVNAIARVGIAFLAKIQMKLGVQKIDVLLDYPSCKIRTSIFAIANKLVFAMNNNAQYFGCKLHGGNASVICIETFAKFNEFSKSLQFLIFL